MITRRKGMAGRSLKKVVSCFPVQRAYMLTWHKIGTYTYPISFAIPGHAPPSLECTYGSVVWRLKANVHRPGAFKTKLAAHREVVVVSSPTEEDTEDTENIIVERLWDNQLQYLIAISGRSFYIGGTIPVSFTLMPLAKIKVHRISVYLEGNIHCNDRLFCSLMPKQKKSSTPSNSNAWPEPNP